MSDWRFTLSKEQQAAVSFFGADTGVSAAAGSGKTTVLVERYLEAIQKKGAWPENILAVTFTDKAANVMKERLRRRSAELGLEEVRRRLDGAWIGTIHSFCARLLKENPVECGIDPAFTVLGAGKADVLMDEVMDTLFEQESSNTACLRLMADIGETPMREALKAFYDQRRADADGAALMEAKTFEKEGREAEKELRTACERLISGASSKLSGPEEKRVSAAAATLEALGRPSEGWERLRSVPAPCGALKKNSSKTKESVTLLQDLAERWAGLYAQKMTVPLKLEWAKLVGRFSELYEAEKRRLGAHDFEDLLCFTHRALHRQTPESVSLRKRLQDQFEQLFVDEYQDTSLLQAGILERLKRNDNLFVVGDARQSIYRFRHAHPEMFVQALERSKRFSLVENYRSRPEILDLVNHIFGELFGKAHEALESRRPFKQKKAHCVERIAVPKDERLLDPLRVLEARSIASRVRELIDSGFKVEERGVSRPATYRDFAILMRKTTASRLYEKELEAFGIPYFVNKGRGFYEKTEVADLVNFLRILENPSENIAMASILRSPLVQVSDDALFWLSKKRLSSQPEGTLYSALLAESAVPELSAQDRARIQDLLSFFDRLREQKDRLKLSELLHRIVDATAYEAKLLTKPGGRQALANIRKLIEMAGVVEDRSIRGISDFVRYLKSVSESSETESEARVIGEDEDVLRILTVHAAKGMEFPCVILADLGGEAGKAFYPVFLASAKHGLGARLKDPLEGGAQADASYSAISEEEKRKEAEEGDRLLYVAMTRAKEHLILAGIFEEAKEGAAAVTWMQKLSRFLEASPVTVKELPVITRRPAAVKPSLLADRLPAQAEPGFAERFLAGLTAPDKKYQTLEDLTVSRLVETQRMADDVPTGDVRSAIITSNVSLGTSSGEDDEAENGSTPRNEFGTVFHLLMELSARHSPRGRLTAERLQALTAVLTPEEKKEMTDAFQAFWKGPMGEEVKKSAKCYPELPFIYKTKHGLLKGQMDLVFKDAKGQWVILDYKTSRLLMAGDKEKAVKTYTWQLGLYALAFWRLYGKMPARTALYFSTANESVELSWDAQKLSTLSSELEELYLASVTPKPLDF